MQDPADAKRKIEDAGKDHSNTPKWYHINRHFLPIKLVYFWNFSASYTIQPLLTLQMMSLGLTLADVAQVYLFIPISSFLAPLVIGLLADQTGRIRALYIGCVVVHCLLHHVLLYVPLSAHTTPEAMAASANGTSLSCTDWPPPSCGNLTRSLECRLSCYEAGSSGGESCGLIVCPAAGSCRQAGPAAVLQLPLGSDGCQLPATLTDNSSELQLFHSELSCPPSCRLECTPAAGLPVSDRNTYWMYFCLRLAATFFLKPTFTLLDATNLALVKEFQAAGQNFGRQRVTAILATVIMPPLVGLFIDFVSGDGPTDYSPAFFVTDVCGVLAIITVFAFHLNVTLPEKPRLGQITEILKRPEAVVFIIVVTILGAMWGFLESFLFIFLKELNAPNYMLGLTMTVAGLASMPFNWWSDAITKRVGHVNVLIMAFFGYAIRYIGYSFIRNPWLCFPFELLEVVTTHLMWNSAATYTGQLAPPGLLATMMGVSGMLHYNVGRGLGSFAGGYLMAGYGAAFTFRVMGIASGVCGVLYTLIYYCWLHRHIARRQKREQGAKPGKTMTANTSVATITTIIPDSKDDVESTQL